MNEYTVCPYWHSKWWTLLNTRCVFVFINKVTPTLSIWTPALSYSHGRSHLSLSPNGNSRTGCGHYEASPRSYHQKLEVSSHKSITWYMSLLYVMLQQHYRNVWGLSLLLPSATLKNAARVPTCKIWTHHRWGAMCSLGNWTSRAKDWNVSYVWDSLYVCCMVKEVVPVL